MEKSSKKEENTDDRKSSISKMCNFISCCGTTRSSGYDNHPDTVPPSYPHRDTDQSAALNDHYNIIPPYVPNDCHVLHQLEKCFRMKDMEIEQLYRKNVIFDSDDISQQNLILRENVRDLQQGLCSLHMDVKKFCEACLHIEDRISSELYRIFGLLKEIMRNYAMKFNHIKRELDSLPTEPSSNNRISNYNNNKSYNNNNNIRSNYIYNIHDSHYNHNNNDKVLLHLRSSLSPIPEQKESEIEYNQIDNNNNNNNTNAAGNTTNVSHITSFDVVKTELSCLRQHYTQDTSTAPLAALERSFENIYDENRNLQQTLLLQQEEIEKLKIKVNTNELNKKNSFAYFPQSSSISSAQFNGEDTTEISNTLYPTQEKDNNINSTSPNLGLVRPRPSSMFHSLSSAHSIPPPNAIENLMEEPHLDVPPPHPTLSSLYSNDDNFFRVSSSPYSTLRSQKSMGAAGTYFTSANDSQHTRTLEDMLQRKQEQLDGIVYTFRNLQVRVWSYCTTMI